MSFAPTDEQIKILDRIVSMSAPTVIINAGPGCGKTTTLIEAMKLMAPGWKQQWTSDRCRVIYTAFNKDIVNTTKAKLIDAKINNASGIYKVDCATFNSIGLRKWRGSLENPRAAITIAMSKNADCLKWVQDQGRFSISPDEWNDLKELMRLAKSQGWLPKGSGSAFGSMIDFKSLCALADITPEVHFEAILTAAMLYNIRQCFAGIMDFDDQLYMAALFSAHTEARPLFVFVDEAQDLTPIQLFLLKRMKPEFLVLVGDPLQAIYAFRGAMSDSFKRIYASYPDAVQLPLLTSFRVPQATIELLRERNPDLRTMSKTMGELKSPAVSMSVREVLNLGAGTKAILCRNNAPLYRAALAMLGAKIPFNLSDEGFGKGIVTAIKRVMRGNMDARPDPAFLVAMQTFWQQRAGEDVKLLAFIYDKIAALEALIDITHPSSINALCLSIIALTKKNESATKNTPLLSTAHKAKGLEFDLVVHLDSHLIPNRFATRPEQLAQEANIAYVINSRSKHTLAFIDSANILIPGSVTRPPRNPAIKGAPYAS